MTQLTLAYSRKTDPQTSKEAAQSLKPPVLRTINQMILDELRHYGPQIADELVARTAIPWATLTPRLAPLRRKGLIRAAGSKRGNSGLQQTLWEIVR